MDLWICGVVEPRLFVSWGTAYWLHLERDVEECEGGLLKSCWGGELVEGRRPSTRVSFLVRVARSLRSVSKLRAGGSVRISV